MAFLFSYMRKLLIIATLITSLTIPARSQTLEELEAELAALEMELDSFSIFSLLDSILAIEPDKSEINVGFGYSSQVLTAGQTLFSNQHGFNTSIGYYHKSGAFANYGGYINSEYEPRYFLHNLSAGYMGTIGSKWSFTGIAQTQLYADTLSTPIPHSISTSWSYSPKKLSTSLNYTFYFGEQTAHQFMPSISYFGYKRKFWFLKSISAFPTVNFMIGTPNVLYASVDKSFIIDQWFQNELTEEQYIWLISTSAPFSRRQVTLYDAIAYNLEVIENNRLSLLTTMLSLPITLGITDHLSLTLSYTYLIPNELVLGTIGEYNRYVQRLGEILPQFQERLDGLNKTVSFDGSESTGYFGANLMYNIPFSSKK